jgi:fibronectin type 3 domain-containing protein
MKRNLSLIIIISSLAFVACSSPPGGAPVESPPVESPPVESPPAAPVIASVDNSTPNQLKIVWGSVPGATGYHIFYDWDSNGSFATRINGAIVTATSYTDDPVLPLFSSTRYYYKVQAVNDAGASPLSGSVGNTTATPTTTVAPPTNFSVSRATGLSGVQLSWTGSSSPGSILGYDIFRSSSRSGTIPTTPLNNVTITKTAYSDTSATPGTTYYYAVCCVYSTGSAQADGSLSPFVPGYR